MSIICILVLELVSRVPWIYIPIYMVALRIRMAPPPSRPPAFFRGTRYLFAIIIIINIPPIPTRPPHPIPTATPTGVRRLCVPDPDLTDPVFRR